MSRRSILGAAVASAVASRAQAQLVYRRSDWDIKSFNQVAASPARIKQVYDVTAPGGGKFLNNIKNSLNGLHFGFGIPVKDIQVVAALHGAANMLNFGDPVWEKYRIGETFQVVDPATGKPAIRNPFYHSKPVKQPRSQDPNDEESALQDKSIEALQARGVRFLSCHTASEEQARVLIRRWKLNQSPEEVVTDMKAHMLPGVLVVASMVAAIAVLQAEGHYTYLTV